MEYIKQNFADGQTLKADHLNHIEDGIYNLATNSDNGGASDCDWNIMKNKPFGETFNRLIGVENAPITFENATDMSGNPMGYGVCYHTALDNMNDMVVGDSVVVTIDGVEREYVVESHEYMGMYAGNASMVYTTIETNNTYPDADILLVFHVNYSMGEEAIIESAVIYTDPSLVGEHEISIYAEQSELKQLDPKYLPEQLQFSEENRTMFLCDNESIEIVEKSSPAGAYYQGEPSSFGEIARLNESGNVEIAIKDGDVVTVVIDDTEYETTATVDTEYNTIAFGDSSFATVPFVVEGKFYSGDSFEHSYVYIKTSEDLVGIHVISICWNGSIIKRIDEKFIPSEIVREGVVPSIVCDKAAGIIYAGETGKSFTSKVIESQAPVVIAIGEYYNTETGVTTIIPLNWSITLGERFGEDYYGLGVGLDEALGYDVKVRVYSNYKFNPTM